MCERKDNPTAFVQYLRETYPPGYLEQFDQEDPILRRNLHKILEEARQEETVAVHQALFNQEVSKQKSSE